MILVVTEGMDSGWGRHHVFLLECEDEARDEAGEGTWEDV